MCRWLPFAQQFTNRPDHRVFLRTVLVLLGFAAHGQPQFGALAGTARPTMLAHPHPGIALHTALPGADAAVYSHRTAALAALAGSRGPNSRPAWQAEIRFVVPAR